MTEYNITTRVLRDDSTYPNYLCISTDALLALRDSEAHIAEHPSTSDKEYCRMKVRSFNHYAVALVFAGMCVESFLYDYAAHLFGDEFVRTHLDKLRFLSKCSAYPRLITGSNIDKSGAMWHALTRLKEERNDLVHWKSAAPHSNPDVENKRTQKRLEKADTLLDTCTTAYMAIRLFAVDLCALHSHTGQEHPFPELLLRHAEEELKRVQQ